MKAVKRGIKHCLIDLLLDGIFFLCGACSSITSTDIAYQRRCRSDGNYHTQVHKCGRLRLFSRRFNWNGGKQKMFCRPFFDESYKEKKVSWYRCIEKVVNCLICLLFFHIYTHEHYNTVKITVLYHQHVNYGGASTILIVLTSISEFFSYKIFPHSIKVYYYFLPHGTKKGDSILSLVERKKDCCLSRYAGAERLLYVISSYSLFVS